MKDGERLFSIGFAACQLQVSVCELAEAFRALKQSPRLVINDIPHFDDRQLLDAQLHIARQMKD